MTEAEHGSPGRALRVLIVLLLVAGLLEALRRLLRPGVPAIDDGHPSAASVEAAWPPLPAPARADSHDDGDAPWVEPVEGACPETHPVKAKLSSGIYHLPGMLNYERTRPDRCYRTGDAAEADGLRKAKR